MTVAAVSYRAAVGVATFAVLVFLLEKVLPIRNDVTFEDLSEDVVSWYKQGFYVDIAEHKMFTMVVKADGCKF